MWAKRWAKRAAGAIAIVILLALIAAGAGAAWVMQADLRPLVERKVSAALGRAVSIGRLDIGWGDPLRLDISDLRLANAPWGTRPDMVTVESIHALIDLRPLLRGVIRYRQLAGTRPVVFLERNAEGVGNWKFAGASGGTSSSGGFAVVPKDRTQFPTLLDFALQDGEVTYVTTSGKALVTRLGHVAIQAASDSDPITISAIGTYNDLPAQLHATAASFDELRQRDTPFGTNFTLVNDDGTISFRGTMMQPLDFDGVTGALTIDMGTLGTLLKALDAGIPADFPATIAGTLTRSGDHWQLDGIEGDLAKNAFTGMLKLDEGPRGGTDRLGLKLRFDRLLADALLPPADAKAKPGDYKAFSLALPDAKAPAVDADIAAKRFQYRKFKLADVALVGNAAPGKLQLKSLKFGLAGAPVQLTGRAEPAGKATRLRLAAGIPGANLGQLLTTFGLATDQVSGSLSLRAEIDATGATLGDALGRNRGSLVLAMVGGKIARDLLEKASVDLRSLFRTGEGMSKVQCLLGVAAIKDGVATVSPLVLRTPEATLNGGGTIDLNRETMDLRIKSERASTGFFALDLPIRVAGPFAKLSAGPAAKKDPPPPPPVTGIPDAARKMAEASGCLK